MILGYFYLFGKNFGFLTGSYSIRGTPEKIQAVWKNLANQSFSCLSAIYENTWHHSWVLFCSPPIRCQKLFGYRFRVSRSKIYFKKWRLKPKWPCLSLDPCDNLKKICILNSNLINVFLASRIFTSKHVHSSRPYRCFWPNTIDSDLVLTGLSIV